MIQYTQKRVGGVADFERKSVVIVRLMDLRLVLIYPRRLNTLGYRMGLKMLELHAWRTEGTSKAPKRETRFLTVLSTIGNVMWKSFFGRAMDAIQKSVTKDDECASQHSLVAIELTVS